MMNEHRAAHIRRIESDIREIMEEYHVSVEIALELLKIAEIENISNELYDMRGM